MQRDSQTTIREILASAAAAAAGKPVTRGALGRGSVAEWLSGVVCCVLGRGWAGRV